MLATTRYASTLLLLAAIVGCRARTPPTAPPPEAPPRTYTYAEAGDRELSAYVFFPPDHGPRQRVAAILLFHGGGWSAGSAEWTFDAARRYAQLGLVAVSVEYRLSEGGLTPADALADACAAFRWVRRESASLGVDPARVAGYGVSAGGHLVAATATVGCPPAGSEDPRPRPDVLLLWSPAVAVAHDGWFARLLGEGRRAEDYSPVEHVGAGVPPTIIVQGAEDSLTPLAGAERFCDSVRDAGGSCEMKVYPGLGHLLTRNLARQESAFDPDPEARADGIAAFERFLRSHGFVR